MAGDSAVNGGLDDESYARAALTYLAEPADRWLGGLIRIHGAVRTLDAIRSGRLPGAGSGAADAAGDGALASAPGRAADAG